MPGGVVDDVDLAGVKTGFQRVERKIELKNSCLAFPRIQFAQLYERALIDLRFATEERDIREQMNSGLGLATFSI